MRTTKNRLQGKVLMISILATVFVVALQFISFRSTDFTNNIDGSWPFTLSTLRHSEQSLGADIYYTYGPYFSKIATYPLPADSISTFLSSLLYTLLLLGGLGLITIYSYRQNSRSINNLNRSSLLAITSGIVISVTSIDSVFYAFLAVCALAVRKEKSVLTKFVLASALMPLAFYKVSFSIAFVLIMALAFIPENMKREKIKDAAVGYGATLAFYSLCFGLLAGAAPTSVLNYIKYGLLNSSAYTDFMSLAYSSNRSITTLFIAVFYTALVVTITSVIASTILHKRRIFDERHIAYAIIMATSFFVLKQAVVRSDAHLVAFLPFLPLVIGVCLDAVMRVLPRIRDRILWRKPLIIALAMIFSFFCVAAQARLYQQASLVKYAEARAGSLYTGVISSPVNYWAFKASQGSTDAAIKDRGKETRGVGGYIKSEYGPNRRIFFYGNTTSLGEGISSFGDVKYMPFLQNYAAFPPALFDDLYINALPKDSEHLLFIEETEPSINERIPSHELSKFFQYVRANYKVVYRDEGRRQYLLKRLKSTSETCLLRSSAIIKKGEAFTPPAFDKKESSYTKLRMSPVSPFLEDILNILVKRPLYSIELRSTDGGYLPRRTTLPILDEGIAVNPLHIAFTDVSRGTPVDLQSLTVRGGLDKGGLMKAEFYSCTFE